MRLYQALKRPFPEPFPLFFFLGWLMGLFFIGIWPAYVILKTLNYPGAYHSQGAISLFVGSFAIGFLVTALPRFTGTVSASIYDVLVIFSLCIVEYLCLINIKLPLASLVMSLKFLYLFYFAFSRARNKTLAPPASFIWVTMALVSIILGGFGSFIISLFHEHTLSFGILFKNFIFRGFLTSLFMGVGGRIVPLLTQMPIMSPLNHDVKNHLYAACIYFLGLIFESLLPSPFLRWGLGLQALALVVEIIFFWKLYYKPKGGIRSVALWASSWFVVFGPLFSFIWPQHTLHLMHLTFVGTFAAATMTVASHVVVSHRELKKDLVTRFWPLGIIWGLIALAALTRGTAFLASYESHLNYAGVLVVISLIIWAKYFLFAKR